jgi:hypothetical protein
MTSRRISRCALPPVLVAAEWNRALAGQYCWRARHVRPQPAESGRVGWTLPARRIVEIEWRTRAADATLARLEA